MDKTPMQMLYTAIADGNVLAVRSVLREHPEVLEVDLAGETWLHIAAGFNNVDVIQVLVEAGIEVNVGRDNDPYGPLFNAARSGSFEVARWLLDHGAYVNAVGPEWGAPLISAVNSGKLEMVELFLERGAEMNRCWGDPPHTALSFAETYGYTEIAQYLKGEGGVLPGEDIPAEDATPSDILTHVRKHLGPVQELALTEIVPGQVAVAVHVAAPAAGGDRLTLVTTGMSDRPMAVPQGAEDLRFAELLIHLPPDWPLTRQALAADNNSWPVEWLRRIAHHPHDNHTWITEGHVVSNGDPAEPLASGTGLVCFLLLREPTDFGVLRMQDGKIVNFYELVPLYREERELLEAKGIVHLIELFESYGIENRVDPLRDNVALREG